MENYKEKVETSGKCSVEKGNTFEEIRISLSISIKGTLMCSSSEAAFFTKKWERKESKYLRDNN